MNIVAVWDEGFPSFCFVLLSCVHRFGKAEGGSCFFCRNLRLRIFQRVELVLCMRVEGVVKFFERPFAVTDAQAHVIFLFGMFAIESFRVS